MYCHEKLPENQYAFIGCDLNVPKESKSRFWDHIQLQTQGAILVLLLTFSSWVHCLTQTNISFPRIEQNRNQNYYLNISFGTGGDACLFYKLLEKY